MEENFVKRYDALVIDSVNFAYRTFKIEGETPVRISKKTVYKDSICNFIDSVEDLKNKYLKSDGQVYLLFDNYFSRADLRRKSPAPWLVMRGRKSRAAPAPAPLIQTNMKEEII